MDGFDIAVKVLPAGIDPTAEAHLRNAIAEAALEFGLAESQTLIVGEGVDVHSLDDAALRELGLARWDLLRDVVVGAGRLLDANEGDDAYRAQRWRELHAAAERAHDAVYPL